MSQGLNGKMSDEFIQEINVQIEQWVNLKFLVRQENRRRNVYSG